MQLNSFIYGEVVVSDVISGQFTPLIVALMSQSWFKLEFRYCFDNGAVAFSGTGDLSEKSAELFCTSLVSAGLLPGFRFAYSSYKSLSDWSYGVSIVKSGIDIQKYVLRDDEFGFWSKVIPQYLTSFFKVLRESTIEMYGTEFQVEHVRNWMMTRMLGFVNK